VSKPGAQRRAFSMPRPPRKGVETDEKQQPPDQDTHVNGAAPDRDIGGGGGGVSSIKKDKSPPKTKTGSSKLSIKRSNSFSIPTSGGGGVGGGISGAPPAAAAAADGGSNNNNNNKPKPKLHRKLSRPVFASSLPTSPT
ncbi:unnamed protein product, partial [Ectocarpus sp. 8 AP-2014]